VHILRVLRILLFKSGGVTGEWRELGSFVIFVFHQALSGRLNQDEIVGTNNTNMKK
jgi:hypothetical protein